MMLDYLKTIIFGIVQGVTEFLPISSSGHLVLFHDFLSLPVQNELTFDVLLHLATLIAVIVVFWQDIKMFFLSWLNSFLGKKSKESSLSWKIILATIPAVIFGLLFNDFIEQNFRNKVVVSVMLILVGIMFIFVEKKSKVSEDIYSITAYGVLFIGLAQALALIPGTSRSGITIIATLMLNLKRTESVRFSFLLSIPIIFGASMLGIKDVISQGVDFDQFFILAIGFISALISAFFAIKFLLAYTSKKDFLPFAYYRIALGIIILSSMLF